MCQRGGGAAACVQVAGCKLGFYLDFEPGEARGPDRCVSVGQEPTEGWGALTCTGATGSHLSGGPHV